MTVRPPIRAVFTALMMLATAAAAAADQPETFTRLDLTDTSIGFTSPGNAYGPWNIQDLRATFSQTGRGAVALELAHQTDGDVNYPTHGNYIGAGIIRDLSSRFYAYLNYGYGTASPYVKTDLHLEADYKATPDLKLVFGGSEDFVTYYSNTALTELSVGPMYYFDRGDLMVHYTVSNNTNAATKSGVWIAGDYIPTFRSKYTVTALLGPQQYQVALPAIPLAMQSVAGQTYTLSTEQQIGRTDSSGRRWGIKAGAFLSSLKNTAGGSLFYVGRGLDAGLWVTQ